MIQLGGTTIAKAILRNMAHGLGVARYLNQVLHRRPRGGVRWGRESTSRIADHVLEIFSTLLAYVGPLDGTTGLEIGPGDNLGVAYAFLKSGCRKIRAVEQFDSVSIDSSAFSLFREIRRTFPSTGQPGLPAADGYRRLKRGRRILAARRCATGTGALSVPVL